MEKSMETRLQLRADFQPYWTWRREEEQEVLEVHLNGYRQDQLHACINDKGEVTIGKRRTYQSCCKTIKVCTGCKKVDSFCEIIKVSTNCRREGIDIAFSNGVLYLKMPKRTHCDAVLKQQLRTAAITLNLGAVAVLLVVAAVQAFVGCK